MFGILCSSTKLYLCICICICVFVYLTVGHLGISFLTFLNQQLFRNIAYVLYFWHFNKAVFVYLYLCICICICVFVYLTVGHLGISFLTSLNQQLFRNIAYVWYSWHFNKAVFVYLYLYLCICVFDSWEYQF